jgi:hypothetical protein
MVQPFVELLSIFDLVREYLDWAAYRARNINN